MIRDEHFKVSIYYLFRTFKMNIEKRQKKSISKNLKRINFIILDNLLLLSRNNSSFSEKIST